MYLIEGFDVGHLGDFLEAQAPLDDELLDLSVGVGANLGLHLWGEEESPQVGVALGGLGLVADFLRLRVDVLRPRPRRGWCLGGPSNGPLLPLPLPVPGQMNLVP
jgi:hypothetical protein